MKSTFLFFFIFFSTQIFCQKNTFITNPIRSGLSDYGMKDCFLIPEKNQFYLLGTEYPDPFKPNSEGLHLFNSKDLNNWENSTLILNNKNIPANAWYKDQVTAPEIHYFNNKYYLIFCARNNQTRPYKKMGIGIAVSDNIDGDYKVLNTKKPLEYGSNPTLVFHDNKSFMSYDMDGRFYMSEIDLPNANLMTAPKEFLGPNTLKEDYKYLDNPQFFYHNGLYHLTFSQFYGGYIIKVFDMVASHPMGPYTFTENKLLYTWLEAEADMVLKAKYPSQNYFAPPTQVIFSNQIVKLSDNKFINVFHSSEKYSEPYLCIDPVKISGNTLQVLEPKAKTHSLVLE